MRHQTCLAVVLAAGEGTRMRSAKPKVLHEIAGRSLLAHVLTAVKDAGTTAAAVVVGPNCEAVGAEATRVLPDAQIFVQTERRGTAHAVLAARKALAQGAKDILVIFGDTPLISADTLKKLRDALHHGASVAVLGFRPADPRGYGRLITNGHRLVAIREDRDASDQERRITLCNGGLMALKGEVALDIIERITDNNAKREFYLTDAVAIADSMALEAVAIETSEDEVRGINTRSQLADAEDAIQWRLRDAAMDAGVTMVAPETVYLSADTKLGRDVVIEPNVIFGPGVTVEDDAVIHAFCYFENAHIGKGALVGPFARLRPGAHLGPKTRIGNFVEVKAAFLEEGAKANHLAYIGDATVGANTNIGAGTIFCNYDGKQKYKTNIGKGAFIGSNSALVSPVTIGEGAYIGSGSVITENVPAGALAIGRGRQVNKTGWVKGGKEKTVAEDATVKPADRKAAAKPPAGKSSAKKPSAKVPAPKAPARKKKTKR